MVVFPLRPGYAVRVGLGLVIVVAADEFLVVDAEVALVVAVCADLLRQRDHPGHGVVVAVHLDHDRHCEPHPPARSGPGALLDDDEATLVFAGLVRRRVQLSHPARLLALRNLMRSASRMPPGRRCGSAPCDGRSPWLGKLQDQIGPAWDARRAGTDALAPAPSADSARGSRTRPGNLSGTSNRQSQPPADPVTWP